MRWSSATRSWSSVGPVVDRSRRRGSGSASMPRMYSSPSRPTRHDQVARKPPATGWRRASNATSSPVASRRVSSRTAGRSVVGIEELDEGPVHDRRALGSEGAAEGVVGPEDPPAPRRDGAQQATRRGELAEVEAGFDVWQRSPSARFHPPERVRHAYPLGAAVTLPAVPDFADRYGPWAIVTGAAQGVGLAFTDALLERGCSVVLVDRQPEVRDVAAAAGSSARAVVADLADPAWLDDGGRGRRRPGDRSGRRQRGGVLRRAASSTSRRRAARATVAVNCLATTELAAWALPPMVARGRGGFVVTSSGSALAGTAAVATYSASKAFGLNLAEAIGWELRDTGVDCLAVVAPSMDTPGWRSHPVDEAAMLQPAVDPRVVVDGRARPPARRRLLPRRPGLGGGGRHRTPPARRSAVERHGGALPRRRWASA